ncbi:MAG: DUF1822 family protein [Cyanobacteria bacterium P01_D01_bin.128]
MSSFTEFQPLEFDIWQADTVDLFQADIDWAIAVSQSFPVGHQQWQRYLQALALRSLDHWLGGSDLSVALAATFGPATDTTGLACQVGDYRVRVIAQGSLSDESIPVPAAVLTHGAAADFYILVNVQDEAEQATILAGLRGDRLRAHQTQTELPIDSEGLCWLPAGWFNIVPEELLLLLTCLDPQTLATSADMDAIASASPLTEVAAGVINVGRWLNDQIDALAEQLSWTLMPPLSSASAMMSAATPVEELEQILADIAPSVIIPTAAKGAYLGREDVSLPFRLYALIWPVFEGEEPEWSLLVVLGPGDSGQLPIGTQLTVSDDRAILAQQSLTTDGAAAYGYAQVFGTWDESFSVAVQIPDGTTFTWPPFVFRPDD